MSSVGTAFAVAVGDVIARPDLRAHVNRSRDVGRHALLLTDIEPQDVLLRIVQRDQPLADPEKHRIGREILCPVETGDLSDRRRGGAGEEDEKYEEKTVHENRPQWHKNSNTLGNKIKKATKKPTTQLRVGTGSLVA